MTAPPEQDAGSTAKRTPWHVGSLTYSTPALLVLFFWLFWGDLAWSVRDRTTLPVMQVMLEKYKASDFLTSMLLGSLPALANILISPIVSYKSDRHRGRWGRRIPFLFLPTPFIALSMLGLAVSPILGSWIRSAPGGSALGENGAILLVMTLLWVTFELAASIANSVFYALINDVVPQNTLGLFYGAFRSLSLIAGIGFNYWFFGFASTHFDWIFFATGAIYTVGLTLMCWKVKEGTYPPPPTPDNVGAIRAAMRYLKDCFSHSYYWWIYVSGAATGLALMPFSLFSYAYAAQLKVDTATYGKASALTYFISLLLSVPLGYLADRLHPLRVVLCLQAMFLLAAIGCGTWVKDANSFLAAFVLQGVLAGSMLTAGASTNARILPKACFAQLASAGAIILCLANIIFSPLLGTVLDKVTHHNYRSVFWIAAVMWSISLALAAIVYRNFLRRGGVRDYVAPDPTSGA